MKKFAVTLALFAFFATNAFADIRLPDTPKPKASKTADGRLVIRINRSAKEAKLIIPKNQVKQLRAQLEEMDNGGDTTTATTANGFDFTRTQTIVSGLFLSLAFVFGGVWLVRARKSENKIAKKAIGGAAILCLLSATAATNFIFANAGPPAQLRSITSVLFDKKAFNGWSQASGKIKIEIADTTATNIELVVPDAEKTAPGGGSGE